MGVPQAKHQLPTTPRVSTLATRTTKMAALIFLTSSDRRGCYSMQTLDQLASKLPTGKSIEIMAVGSRTDWNIADQYAQYLKAKGFGVSFSRTSETVPPLDRKITVRDDPTTSPIIVIIAPSAL